MLKSHIKEIMERQGKSLRAVARDAGLGHQTIIRARDNLMVGSCSIDTLKKIARALHVDVKDLFSDIPDETPEP